MRLLSGHILPRSESNFTHTHLDFKKFSRRETPDPCLQGRRTKGVEGKGIKGFTSKGSAEGKDRGGVIGIGGEKEGRGQRQGGGVLLQGLKGDRRPCLSEYRNQSHMDMSSQKQILTALRTTEWVTAACKNSHVTEMAWLYRVTMTNL